jgi:hypothetical protein
MKFYKIQMLGRFLSEYIANVTALTYSASLDKGRILYDETTNKLYFGDNSGGGQFNPIGGSIPSTEIILFEKNTAVSGYTLLTDIDDETVFISKGAGSAIGPGATSVGSWTAMTGHTHPGPSHSHDVGSLAFSATGNTGGVATWSPRDEGGGSNTCADYWHTHSVSLTTGGGSGNTGSDGTGATSASAAIATWRPAGRIFTRQQRI